VVVAATAVVRWWTIIAGVACRANDFCGSCSASGLTSRSRELQYSIRIHRVFYFILTCIYLAFTCITCSHFIHAVAIDHYVITSASSSTGHSNQQHTIIFDACDRSSLFKFAGLGGDYQRLLAERLHGYTSIFMDPNCRGEVVSTSANSSETASRMFDYPIACRKVILLSCDVPTVCVSKTTKSCASIKSSSPARTQLHRGDPSPEAVQGTRTYFPFECQKTLPR